MAETVDLTQQPTASILPFLRKLASQVPMGPPVPPPEEEPQPDFAPLQPQAPPQPPPNPMADLTAFTPEAPKPAGETKAHKLLRIIAPTVLGGFAGAGQMTVGGGFQQAQNLGIQRAMLPWEFAQKRAQLGKTQAEISGIGTKQRLEEAQIAGMPAKQALEQAQAEAANYKDDPNLGLIDLRNKQPVNPQGVVPIQDQGIADVLGKNIGDRIPIKLYNTADEIRSRAFTNVQTEEGVFERNRKTGSMTRLGSNPRMMFAPEQRIMPVVDPNNPGNVIPMKAGEAIKQGVSLPQSADAQAAKATAKKAAAGNWADQKIAFNTAIQHAELLREAAKALNNGDVRLLNSVKNRLATEFGDPDVTNFQAIANAYNHEITSVISKGHITDNEVKEGGRTLPLNANYETIDKVLKSYQSLAQSKMNMLQKQIDEGMKGNTGYTPPVGAPTATGPNGHKLVLDGGKWVDATTGKPN